MRNLMSAEEFSLERPYDGSINPLRQYECEARLEDAASELEEINKDLKRSGSPGQISLNDLQDEDYASEVREELKQIYDVLAGTAYSLKIVVDDLHSRDSIVQGIEDAIDERTRVMAEEMADEIVKDACRKAEMELEHEKAKYVGKTAELERSIAAIANTDILKGVMLELELDVSPEEILSNIKRRFGALIQVW